MKQLLTLFCLSVLVMGCSVTESIVFNEQMGGNYKTSFDFSQMLALAQENSPQTEEPQLSQVIDTTIVFNDFMEQNKDSIAGLPEEKQMQLNTMRGVAIEMHMDEAKGIYNFTLNKPFDDFQELKQVNAQLDGAMKLAESMGKTNSDPSPPNRQMDDLMKSDPVVYSFSNNTFKRFQPQKETSTELEADEAIDASVDMMEGFKMQCEEVFEAAFYTMTYTFPKPIKSVSNKEAVISEDRKTMTLKYNLNAIEKDPTLMDLEIILEE